MKRKPKPCPLQDHADKVDSMLKDISSVVSKYYGTLSILEIVGALKTMATLIVIKDELDSKGL